MRKTKLVASLIVNVNSLHSIKGMRLRNNAVKTVVLVSGGSPKGWHQASLHKVAGHERVHRRQL